MNAHHSTPLGLKDFVSEVLATLKGEPLGRPSYRKKFVFATSKKDEILFARQFLQAMEKYKSECDVLVLRPKNGEEILWQLLEHIYHLVGAQAVGRGNFWLALKSLPDEFERYKKLNAAKNKIVIVINNIDFLAPASGNHVPFISKNAVALMRFLDSVTAAVHLELSIVIIIFCLQKSLEHFLNLGPRKMFTQGSTRPLIEYTARAKTLNFSYYQVASPESLSFIPAGQLDLVLKGDDNREGSNFFRKPV